MEMEAKTKMKKLIHQYQKNFPFILTLAISLVLASLTAHIPYVNFAPHFFSTVILAGSLFMFVWMIEDTLEVQSKILLALLGISLILELLTFSYQAEIVGDLFYILLFYVTIKEARKRMMVKRR
jgi:hypothetical protein